MKILIIEDEQNAVEKLERVLGRYDSSLEIVGRTKSISESVIWLENPKNSPDLILSDIQLTDGLSFEIFKQLEVKSPIIFITAFDEYALEAFKLNSIAYLLKPVSLADLSESMEKLKNLQSNFSASQQNQQLQALQNALGMIQQNPYKERFMVKLGEHIRSVPVERIEFFYAEGRTVFLITKNSKKFVIDYKLEQLEKFLNPTEFMRVNRSFILNIRAIKEVLVYSQSRLKVEMNLESPKEIIISRDKVGGFKEWFGGEN